MALGHGGGGLSSNPTTPHWLPPAPPLLIQGGESFLDDLHFRMFASTARSLANVLFHAC